MPSQASRTMCTPSGSIACGFSTNTCLPALSAVIAMAACMWSGTVALIAMTIVAPKAEGEVFNVGSDEEVTVLELAQRIKRSTADIWPIDPATGAALTAATCRRAIRTSGR